MLVTTTGALTICKNGTTPSTPLSNSWLPIVWKDYKILSLLITQDQLIVSVIRSTRTIYLQNLQRRLHIISMLYRTLSPLEPKNIRSLHKEQKYLAALQRINENRTSRNCVIPLRHETPIFPVQSVFVDLS